MNKGAVWITRGNQSQRLRRATRVLQAGDQIHFYYDERVLAETPPPARLVADCGEYSVWYKPRGMRSQGSKWGDHCTVMRWSEQHLKPERTSYTVHRLDLATHGLILIAHSKTTAASLAKLFRERAVIKHYRAVVHGRFDSNNNNDGGITNIDAPIDGKSARSDVRLIEHATDGSRSLVDVRIYTGRKHQIRRHLAAIGHPVVGDRMHGTGNTDGVDLQLTAWMLSFECPITQQPAKFTLPDELHCYALHGNE
ncbi:MAG: RNA pseudouridine synthase [Gammaproteobacteria bacterium]|nr:RNA pseudouridine synthase [Gammaproteobacteria bacterium]NND54439.1 RNA pseudouridine synthase [Gammaproteobacteria bacterium]